MLIADELRTIGLSEKLVTDVVTFLDGRAGDLTVARPHDVGGGDFGSSPASVGCASDAGKAHDHVYKAITDMVAGLRGYQVALHDMAKQTWDVDATTEAEIKTHHNRADQIRADLVRAEDCVAAPTLASPSTCTLPGASSSGGEG